MPKAFSIPKIKFMNSLYAKLLFVVLAFTLMIVSSYLYVSRILHSHMMNTSLEILANTKNKIEADFSEMKTTLGIISLTVSDMILNGSDEKAVFDYIKSESEYLRNNDVYKIHYNGIHGYFEIFGDKFIYGGDWESPKDFEPMKRPWYTAADAAGGKIVSVPLYNTVDSQAQELVVTYACRISGNDGEPLGVLCLDMPIHYVQQHISDMKITEGSYGVLQSGDLEVLAHPSSEAIGKNRMKSAGAWQGSQTK